MEIANENTICNLILKPTQAWAIASSASTSVPSTTLQRPLANNRCLIWYFHGTCFTRDRHSPKPTPITTTFILALSPNLSHQVCWLPTFLLRLLEEKWVIYRCSSSHTPYQLWIPATSTELLVSYGPAVLCSSYSLVTLEGITCLCYTSVTLEGMTCL